MKNELTLEEVGHIKELEEMGYTISELSHAILHGRETETYNDIKAQIRRLLE